MILASAGQLAHGGHPGVVGRSADQHGSLQTGGTARHGRGNRGLQRGQRQGVEHNRRPRVRAAVLITHGRTTARLGPAHRTAGQHHQLGVLGVELSHRHPSARTRWG